MAAELGTRCFVAGTEVKTPDGHKNIEDIKVGDVVWSRDAKTGRMGYKRVVQTFVTHPETLVHLDYGDDEELVGTPTHPFWVVDRQAWAAMGDIQPGETLLLDDGKEVTVTSTRAEHAPAGETFTTYNFEVKDWHTYFVSPANDLDDDGFVWVHNTCAVEGGPSNAGNNVERHHQLPQQFAEDFERAQIKNLEDYVIDLEKGVHRLKPNGLHTGTGVDNWNGAWRDFFNTVRNPAKQDILDQLSKMRKDFGLE